MKKRLISFILGFCLFSFPVAVLATPSSHEIMLKIAAEQLEPVANAAICSMDLPKNWTVSLNSPDKLQFKVPYHPGILGVIEKTERVLSSDESVKKLSDAFKSEFSIFSDDAFEHGAVSGHRLVLTARLGGEKWKVLVFSGRIASGTNIFYYAVVPEYWFASYQPLLNDVLESFK
ncbi:MAG: hypothetical protein IJU23_09075 [Proteobacteria bacterium]|nr:hypothetical protein [Pseudomonadota bacterium]